MKVYELLNEIVGLPANMEVMITGENNNGEPFPIAMISVEKPAEPGMSCLLCFDDNEIIYKGDVAEKKQEHKAEVLSIPGKRRRGRPKKSA